MTVTVKIQSKAEMNTALSNAVESVRRTATGDRRHGVLVTRLNASTFTVALAADVPYGLTWERDTQNA